MVLQTDKVKGIIWDLDNTLYRFSDAFKAHCNEAAASAAIEKGIDLSHAEALKIAERSEKLHGYSMHIYVTDHGLTYDDLHIPFHQRIDENIIEPIPGAIEALHHYKGTQTILTNASRCWAMRALKFIGAENIFQADEIIPIEEINFEPKASSERGFKKALDTLKLNADEVVMVDDLDRNLNIPHKMGMQTVYMHHGNPMIDKPEFVTDQFKNLSEMMNIFPTNTSQI